MDRPARFVNHRSFSRPTAHLMPLNDFSSENTNEKFQFSLRSLILFALGVGVYVAIAMATVRNHGKLLDIVTDWAAIVALGCLLFASAGFTMMIVSIIRDKSRSRWPTIAISTAVLYAPANVAWFIATLLLDRSAVFDDAYLLVAVLVAPAVMLIAIGILAGFSRELDWLILLGYPVWIVSVAAAHLWIIAAAAASI